MNQPLTQLSETKKNILEIPHQKTHKNPQTKPENETAVLRQASPLEFDDL